jgi:hypothetical protein
MRLLNTHTEQRSAIKSNFVTMTIERMRWVPPAQNRLSDGLEQCKFINGLQTQNKLENRRIPI